MPVFSYERDASTNKVIPNTIQVLEVKRGYSIQWREAKVDELSKSPFVYSRCARWKKVLLLITGI
jgi:hypothetical protein